MHIVTHLDEDVWSRFVNKNPIANIFHTPEMFQVLARTKGYRPSLWGAVDDREQVLALLLPVQITLMNGPLRRFTTRAVAYGSVGVAPNLEGRQALAKLLQAYACNAGNSLLFTELRNLSNLQEVQPILTQSGFVYEDHLNYLIDLRQPQEIIWKNINSRTRNYIRRELKRGELTVIEVDTPERLAVCYELLCKTYESARVPLADYSLFEAMYEILCPKGMARFMLVYLGKIPIATSIDLLYKGVIYYWYGGMDRTYGSHHPNELLRWHIIQWGIENGYRLFDFGGAGKPDEEYSVRDFKAKFGGELVNLGRNICIHSPRLLRLSTLGYGVYRRYLSSFQKAE